MGASERVEALLFDDVRPSERVAVLLIDEVRLSEPVEALHIDEVKPSERVEVLLIDDVWASERVALFLLFLVDDLEDFFYLLVAEVLFLEQRAVDEREAFGTRQFVEYFADELE